VSAADDLAVGTSVLVVVDGEVPGGLVVPNHEVSWLPAEPGRYRITPEAGNAYLDESAVQSKDGNYLFTELAERITREPVRLNVAVQLAEDPDVVDDATVHWPSEREVRGLGTVELTGPVADDAAEQKHVIFDPIPRLPGIEPSADPLLELRAAVYLISGRRRRAA
jgi:catalase